MDCWNVMMPEVMKPTTSTVVIEDDWITAVTAAPANAALNRLVVNLARKSLTRSPATIFSASVILCMPYRNSARPPPRLISITPNSSGVFIGLLR